jgi:dipeptidase E
MKRMLLISNSTLFGSGYLDHCADEIKDFLGNSIKNIMFIPYARPSGIGHAEYTLKARDRYEQLGYNIISVHDYDNPHEALESAEAVFIGGGNTFVLLNGLYKSGLIEELRERVESGMPYIGTSAGSNVAGPTIMTTNDMPVHEVPSFEALNLFPYQLNPHYLDPDTNSQHMGETRETRIKEYLVFNYTPVIGLREGSMIRIEGNDMILKGTTGARIFQRGSEPIELLPGMKLDFSKS